MLLELLHTQNHAPIELIALLIMIAVVSLMLLVAYLKS